MKTTTTEQVPQQWAQILRWLASDEEVQVTQDERIIARILPSALSSSASSEQKIHSGMPRPRRCYSTPPTSVSAICPLGRSAMITEWNWMRNPMTLGIESLPC